MFILVSYEIIFAARNRKNATVSKSVLFTVDTDQYIYRSLYVYVVQNYNIPISLRDEKKKIAE